MSNSLWCHGLKHTRLPCPSVSSRVCSIWYPLSQWCYLNISSSFAPFSFHLQSFPASRLFSMSQLFISGSQILELQLQHQSFQWIFKVDFLRIDWLDLLAVQGTLKSLLQHHNSNALILWCSAFIMIQLSHPFMTTGKTTAFTK